MTDEELDLCKRLQPVFKKKMGPLQVGDWFLSEYSHGIGWEEFVYDTGWKLGPPTDALHFPLPIDPRNPERGLWGMIDWDRFSFHIARDGEMNIFGLPFLGCDNFESGYCTPTIALLKALAAQEGV